MRRITDEQGHDWDVTVGRESYGMQVFLFMPQDGSGVRKALMTADTWLDGERELHTLDQAALLERLGVSVPWEETASY
ncbi:hypothetical protein [Aquisalimonas asiatica]|uniref:Uncharacterized protein n=1 Tax=Aquisalimonas asiatica TaxID=406100 RepID=A0A1H8VH35_9GAMM|nr:hypothetical protein [Aquisalimonas asiatica]SEP14198.1 hypothetical protein SAMN04488052_11231 [Aquisalimonas asiatica]